MATYIIIIIFIIGDIFIMPNNTIRSKGPEGLTQKQLKHIVLSLEDKIVDSTEDLVQ